MRKSIKLAAITFFILVPLPVMSHLAHAQSSCGVRETIIKNLARVYHEKSTALGIVNGENVVELFTSPGGKTWTIIVSEPSGRTCFVSSGSDWTQGPIVKEGSPL